MHKLRNKYFGFTLMEILVSITILGILVAIAMPAYIKYSIKSRATSMYESSTPARLMVANDYFNQGNCTSSSYTYNSTTHIPAFLKPTTYITSISVSTGVISITGDSTKLNGKAINYTIKPSIDNQQQMTWTCCVSSNSFFEYVPPECNNSTSVCTAIPSC